MSKRITRSIETAPTLTKRERQRDARKRRKEEAGARREAAPVILRQSGGAPLPPFRVVPVDTEANADGDTLLVELRQPRYKAVQEEAAHAAMYVIHGVAPKEVAVEPKGFCDSGFRRVPESFARLVAMPSTLVGPMMGGGHILSGEPWPPAFADLDSGHPSSADIRNLARFVEQLELTAADYEQVCARTRALKEHPAFQLACEWLGLYLDAYGFLTRPQIREMFGLGPFSWDRWYSGGLTRPSEPVRILEPAGEETIRIRIPHSLYDRLPLGVREGDAGEVVQFAQDGTDLVITDVVGKEPLVDISSAFYTTDPSADGSRLEMDGDGLRIVEDDGTTAVNLSDDEGLDLTASPAIAVLTRKVRWLDAGVSKAEIYGQKPGANSGQLTLAAIPTTGPSALIVLNADTSQSQLEITADDIFFGNATLHISDGSQIDVGWQNWTPTLTGWSSNPTGGTYRYTQVGKLVHVQIRQPSNGTSNATTKSISAPVTAATITNMRWDGPCAAVDNGTALATSAKARIASGGTTIDFDLDWSGAAGGWTASGGHRISTCTLVYEAA